MARRVNPAFWRLPLTKDYNVSFDGVVPKDYRTYVQVVSRVKLLLDKWLPENYDYKIYFQGGVVTIDLYILSLRLISGKDSKNLLGTVRRSLVSFFPQMTFKLNAKVSKKNEINSGVIALALAQMISRRKNVNLMLKDFAKTVMSSARYKGMLVEIKGRFKLSSRASKTIHSVGNLTLQELESKIDYKQMNVVGKYGSSCIKVFLNLV